MHDSRPVELVLELPADVADNIEDLKRRDPEYLSRVIRHGLARRAVFQELRRSAASPGFFGDVSTDRSA
ncbi:MAG: hypothetical protein JJE01_14740 [Gemmatimonadetes bacterium]|nr:hypothetical protein [Gemmatimonadota bacterium]